MSESEKKSERDHLTIGKMTFNGPFTNVVFDVVRSLDGVLGRYMDYLTEKTVEAKASAANLRIHTANMSSDREAETRRQVEGYKKEIKQLNFQQNRLLDRVIELEKAAGLASPPQRDKPVRQQIRENNEKETPSQLNAIKGVDKLTGVNGHRHEEQVSDEGMEAPSEAAAE